MSTLLIPSDADFGPPGAAVTKRRRWLYHRLMEMMATGEFPTTISSLYYDGLGATPAPWLSDEADMKRKTAEAIARGEQPPSKPRTPRQDVSADTQWLIDAGFVPADALRDLSRNLIDHWKPRNLHRYLIEVARTQPLSPWPEGQPQPFVIVESRSLAGALDADIDRYGGLLVPLGGMSGTTFLRELDGQWSASTPMCYLGDFNKPGADIERRAKRWFLERGWRADWAMLAVTETDAETLPSKLKVDGRTSARKGQPSIEAEALGTTELRRRVVEWLEFLLPAGFSWKRHAVSQREAQDDAVRRLEREDES